MMIEKLMTAAADHLLTSASLFSSQTECAILPVANKQLTIKADKVALFLAYSSTLLEPQLRRSQCTCIYIYILID